jgi:hypothetical protein
LGGYCLSLSEIRNLLNYTEVSCDGEYEIFFTSNNQYGESKVGAGSDGRLTITNSMLNSISYSGFPSLSLLVIKISDFHTKPGTIHKTSSGINV